MSMIIELKPEQEKFIQEKIATGEYKSSEEIVDKMFLIFQKVQGNYEQWLLETREKINEGIESLDKGEGVNGELVVNQLKNKIRLAQENLL